MKKSGTTLLLTLISGALLTAHAGACATDSTNSAGSKCQKRKPTRSYYLFQTGVVQVDPDKLNDKLNSVGSTGFSTYAYTAAFGGHKEYKRFVSEDLFSGTWWRKNEDNNFVTSLMTFNFNNTMGFNVLPSSLNLNLFPFAGLGVGVNRLRIHQDRASLSDALSSATPDKIFRQGLVTFNGGVGSDFVVPSRGGTCGFTIGLRGGYYIPLYTSKWYSDRTIISDMPDLRQQGFYVRLAVGGWGSDGKKCEKRCCDSHR